MDESDQMRQREFERLSPAERDVLELARTGGTAAEIAQRLSIAEATVRSHLSRIYAKLGVRGRVELLARLGSVSAATSPPDGQQSEELVDPVPTKDETGPDEASRQARPPRHMSARRILPWGLGAVAGALVGIIAMPVAYYWPPIPVIPFAVAAGLISLLIARRPGGLVFFAAGIGVSGAILVALAASVPLSCPSGEFSNACTNPPLAPIVLPGLGLMIVGTLLVRRARLGRPPK